MRSIIRRVVKALLSPLRKPFPLTFTALYRGLSGHSIWFDHLVEKSAGKIAAEVGSDTNGLFVDCGANEGNILRRYRRCLPGFTFFGFEPLHEVVGAALKKNPGVSILNCAVSDFDGLEKLRVASQFSTNYRGGSSMEEAKVPNERLLEERQVYVLRLSQVLRSFRQAGYTFIAVKMDVEGAEFRILDDLFEDFDSTHQRLLDYLVVEFHPAVCPSGVTINSYHQKLTNMGVVVEEWV